MIPTEVLNDLIVLNQCKAMESRMQAILTALDWRADKMQDTCTWLISNTQSDDDPGKARMKWSDVLKVVCNG